MLKKAILALSLLLCGVVVPANAAWWIGEDTIAGGGGGGGGGNFQSTFDVGGGGYSKSIDIANDGTKVSTVDVWGAYLAQPGTSSQWVPLINETSFASLLSSTGCTADPNLAACWQGDGPFDLRIAHNNSRILFMNWNQQVWRSTDQGATFSNVSTGNGIPDGFGGDTGGNGSTWVGAYNFQSARLDNPKTNIDPTQSILGNLTVIIPTARFGTYISTNGGGSWSLLSGVPTTFPALDSGFFTATTATSTSSGATVTIPSPTNGSQGIYTGSGTVTSYDSSSGCVTLHLNSFLGASTADTIYVSGATGTNAASLLNGAHVTNQCGGFGSNGNQVAAFTIATGQSLTITGGTVALGMKGGGSDFIVVDETTPAAIPPNTFVSSSTATTMTLTNSVTGGGVLSGDTIAFYFPSPWTGGSTYGRPQNVLVAFDPRPNTGAGLYSRNIYIADPGSGVLRSQDDGASWTPLTAGSAPPVATAGSHMIVCNDGNMYYNAITSTSTDPISTLYWWNGSTWTNTGNTGYAIACDPVNANTIAMTPTGGSNYGISTNNGVGFTDSGFLSQDGSTDVPWLGAAIELFNGAEIQYDPTNSLLYEVEGIGVWHTVVGGSLVWKSQTAGINSLQQSRIIKSPAYTYPFMLYWDRAMFSTTNPASYDTPGAVQYPLALTAGFNNNIIGGWGGDYAATTGNVCIVANSNNDALTPTSGCTSDGTNWVQFPMEPEVLSAVTSTGAALGATSIPFTALPLAIYGDYIRSIQDEGLIAITSGSQSTSSDQMTLTSIPSGVTVGDAVNTVGGGFLPQPGYPFREPNPLSTALIESINNGTNTLTLSISPADTIPSGAKVAITQSIEYPTNMNSPNLNVLCLPGFPPQNSGWVVGPGVPHNTRVGNIDHGNGACGGGSQVTIELTNNMTSLGVSGTLYHFGYPNSPLSGQAPDQLTTTTSTGNSSTTLNITPAVVYPSLNFASNTDGVRPGDTIAATGFDGGQLVMATPLHSGDPNNVLFSPGQLAGGPFWPLYTTDGGVSWNPAILCNSPTAGNTCGTGTPPGFDSLGRQVSGGGNCYSSSVFGNNIFAAADRVNPNTFYVFNSCSAANGGGIYKSADGGATWTLQTSSWGTPPNFYIASGGAFDYGAWNGPVAVPGFANQLWYSQGSPIAGAYETIASGGLFRSCDGGATWAEVDGTNLKAVATFDFGAPTPGGTAFPSVIMYGDVNGVWGIWRGDNILTTCTADPGQRITWTKIGDRFFAGSLNSSLAGQLVADMNKYGQYYINATGGAIYGLHN